MAGIILFTGKGGVGKTSAAAAHAVKYAEEGKKTLLVSADMAHNIGDIFQTRIGRKPVLLAENFYALELDPDRLLSEEFPKAAAALRKLLLGNAAGLQDAEGDFPFPGLEDLFSLLKIKALWESGEYDRILVDCAPSGETLSLLKLPELLSWYMEKFFPVGKTMIRILSPVSKLRYHTELPDREAMDEIGEMHRELVKLQELLTDSRICRVRLVCLPEKMVVEETKRTFMYLSLYGYRTEAVFINRVIPDGTGNDFLEGWRNIQKGYLEELRRVFREIPAFEIPWYPEEVRGMEAVRKICREIPADEELSGAGDSGARDIYSRVPGGYELLLSAPGAEEGEVRVSLSGTDLNVTISGYIRTIPLPDVLCGIRPGKAVLEDGKLKITFPAEQGSGEAVSAPEDGPMEENQ